MQRRAIRECTRVALGNRVDARAGERSEIEHERRLLPRGERQRVGQHHASLGIAVHDLDRDAVRSADDFLRPVRDGSDLVLGDREPAVDSVWRAEPRQGEQRAERDGAALHVAVHQVHAACGS